MFKSFTVARIAGSVKLASFQAFGTNSAADQVAVAGDGLGLGEPGVVAANFAEIKLIQ